MSAPNDLRQVFWRLQDVHYVVARGRTLCGQSLPAKTYEILPQQWPSIRADDRCGRCALAFYEVHRDYDRLGEASFCNDDECACKQSLLDVRMRLEERGLDPHSMPAWVVI